MPSNFITLRAKHIAPLAAISLPFQASELQPSELQPKFPLREGGIQQYAQTTTSGLPSSVISLPSLPQPKEQFSNTIHSEQAAPLKQDKNLPSTPQDKRNIFFACLGFVSALPLVIRVWKKLSVINSATMYAFSLSGIALSIGSLSTTGFSSSFLVNAVGTLNSALLYFSAERERLGKSANPMRSFLLPNIQELKKRDLYCLTMAVTALSLWALSQFPFLQSFIHPDNIRAGSIALSTLAITLGSLPQIFDLFRSPRTPTELTHAETKNSILFKSLLDGLPWHVFVLLRAHAAIDLWKTCELANRASFANASAQTVLLAIVISLSAGVFYRNHRVRKSMSHIPTE